MNQKTLTKLEYDKIIALLEEEASSFRGRQLCRKLKPMTDLAKINTLPGADRRGVHAHCEKGPHLLR